MAPKQGPILNILSLGKLLLLGEEMVQRSQSNETGLKTVSRSTTLTSTRVTERNLKNSTPKSTQTGGVRKVRTAIKG